MRKTLTALCVTLFCGCLYAASTPFIGIEVVTASLPTMPDFCSQASLAATSDGFVLAYWNDGLDIVRLGRSLEPIGAPQQISPRGHRGTCPAAVARDGQIVVAWKQSQSRAVVAQIPQDGSLLEALELATDLPPGSRLIALAGADSDWIAANKTLFQIRRESWLPPLSPAIPIGLASWDLGVQLVFSSPRTVGTYDSIAANGSSIVATAHASGTFNGECGGFAMPHCDTFPFTSIALAEGNAEPHSIWLNHQPIQTRSTIACTNGDCAVAWFDGTSLLDSRSVEMLWSSEPGAVHTIGQASFPLARADAEIAAASSGGRILVVWQTLNGNRYEIAGVELTRTSTGLPFLIASGEGDRIRPSVIAVNGSTFVVHYEITRGATTRIGMRYVDLDPPVRRRIAR